LEFEPDRLGRRGAAVRPAPLGRKLGVPVELLPDERALIARVLHPLGDGEAAASRADARAARPAAISTPPAPCRPAPAAAMRIAEAVNAGLPPLKLERASCGCVDPREERPAGAGPVEFEVSTNPGAPSSALGLSLPAASMAGRPGPKAALAGPVRGRRR